MLQELRRLLAPWGRPAGGPLPLEPANPDTLVRVAAPTGSAAFNIRFGATTIHRLIHWFRPGHFEELRNDVALNRLQTSLGPRRMLVFDEVSMVGRQMMGRVDSRLSQAKPGGEHPDRPCLGGVSCVTVGDPAQCEPIRDQPLYDVAPHRKTARTKTSPPCASATPDWRCTAPSRTW